MLFLKLLNFELKSLFRSSRIGSEMVSFIFKLIFGIYLLITLLGSGSAVYFLVEENVNSEEPFKIICGFFFLYWLYDLMIRFAISSIPVLSIKPLLVLNINRSEIVKYVLVKGYLTFFNFMHIFFFIPLAFVLISKNYEITSVVIWSISMLLILSANAYLNIFLNKLNSFFYPFVAIVTLIVLGHFNGVFNILPYTTPLSYFFYEKNYSVILAFLYLLSTGFLAYKFYLKQLFLDKSLKTNSAEKVKSLNIGFLQNLGNVGSFVKNDIYLIIRNKRPRTVLLTSVLFIFYPFLLIRSFDELNAMSVFVALFATGGFMISFGQFIPSWDSSYFPFLMSRNVSYRDYLLSKWYIMTFATIITLILCLFYLLINPTFYLIIIAVTIYGIGINTNFLIFTGMYMKQPIDLSSNKGAFGNTKSFNINTLILSLLMMIFPVIFQTIFQLIFNIYVGIAMLAFLGIVGIIFRDKIIDKLANHYSKNKYQTINDFKNQ